MRNVAVIILVILIALSVYQFFQKEEVDNGDGPNGPVTEELEITYIGEGTEAKDIRVLNQNREEVYAIHISELQEWLEFNWEVFEEPPEVAMRTIEPSNINFFDPSASISPDKTKLAFSVHDYSALTTESFIFIANIRSGKLNVINETVRGSVESFIWSTDSDMLAYTLGTARAQSDRLSIDNVRSFEKVLTLTESEILNALEKEDDEPQLMPRFRDLEWNDDQLKFTTDSNSDEEIMWSIDIETGDLQIDAE